MRHTPILALVGRIARSEVGVLRLRIRICSGPIPSFESDIRWEALPQGVGAVACRATGLEETRMYLPLGTKRRPLRQPRGALTLRARSMSPRHWPKPSRICRTSSNGGEAVVLVVPPVEASSKTPTIKFTRNLKKKHRLLLGRNPPPNHRKLRSYHWE